MASTQTCLLVLLALAATAASSQRNFTIVRYLTVNTTTGPIRGAVIETRGSGDSIAHVGSFLGINFAKVPTGEFRFAHPVFTQWDFVQDVLDFDSMCYQDPGASNDFTNMAESCIAANIWTPYNGTTTNPGSYPVLVWIHGGRFESGSITEESYSGRVLTAHESIVTVSLQYRLGVLGFLRLSSTLAPGNMGLKDQALGLEYVQLNIEKFGGNLQTVTLMGLDAGAAAVGYHMLNERTRTFFKRAVMLGGSPLVFWSVRQNTADIERLHAKFAKEKLNCDTDKGLNETLRCLQEVSPELMINAQKEFIKDFQGIEFPPVIDGDYIKEDPIVALRAHRFSPKQLLIGVTNSEAATYIEASLRGKGWTKDDLQDSQKYRSVIEDNFRTYEREPDIMTTNARRFMTDRFTSFSNPSAEVNYRRWLDAASDRLFVCAANEFAELSFSASSQQPVDIYFYVFSVQDNTGNYAGATHGQDAYYFFGNPADDAPIVLPEQALLSVRMMDYLAKFVATGDPVPRDNDRVWAKFNSSLKYYHNFTTDDSAAYNVKYGFHRDDCGFWDKTLKYVNSLPSGGLAPIDIAAKIRVVRETSGEQTFEDANEKCKNVINATTLAIMIPLLISNVVLLGALAWLLVKFCSM